MGCASSKPSSENKSNSKKLKEEKKLAKSKSKSQQSNLSTSTQQQQQVTTNANGKSNDAINSVLVNQSNKNNSGSSVDSDEPIRVGTDLLEQIKANESLVIAYIVKRVHKDLNNELVKQPSSSNGSTPTAASTPGSTTPALNFAAVALAAVNAQDNEDLIIDVSSKAVNLVEHSSNQATFTYKSLTHSLKSWPFLCKNQANKSRICELTVETVRECLNSLNSQNGSVNLAEYLTSTSDGKFLKETKLAEQNKQQPVLMSRTEANELARMLFLSNRGRPVVHASQNVNEAYFVCKCTEDNVETTVSQQEIDDILNNSLLNSIKPPPFTVLASSPKLGAANSEHATNDGPEWTWNNLVNGTPNETVSDNDNNVLSSSLSSSPTKPPSQPQTQQLKESDSIKVDQQSEITQTSLHMNTSNSNDDIAQLQKNISADEAVLMRKELDEPVVINSNNNNHYQISNELSIDESLDNTNNKNSNDNKEEEVSVAVVNIDEPVTLTLKSSSSTSNLNETEQIELQENSNSNPHFPPSLDSHLEETAQIALSTSAQDNDAPVSVVFEESTDHALVEENLQEIRTILEPSIETRVSQNQEESTASATNEVIEAPAMSSAAETIVVQGNNEIRNIVSSESGTKENHEEEAQVASDQPLPDPDTVVVKTVEEETPATSDNSLPATQTVVIKGNEEIASVEQTTYTVADVHNDNNESVKLVVEEVNKLDSSDSAVENNSEEVTTSATVSNTEANNAEQEVKNTINLDQQNGDHTAPESEITNNKENGELDPILQQSLLDDRFYNNDSFKTEPPVNGHHLNDAATVIQANLKGQAVRDELKAILNLKSANLVTQDSANPSVKTTTIIPALTTETKSLFVLPTQLLTSNNNNNNDNHNNKNNEDIASLIKVEIEKNNEDFLIESQIEEALDFAQLILNMNSNSNTPENNNNNNKTSKILKEPNVSSDSLSSQTQSYNTDSRAVHDSNPSSRSTEELDRAAIKIQSTFRGYKTRKNLNKQQLIQQQKDLKKLKKRSNSESDNTSLSVTPSSKKSHLISDPQVAAVKIQSTFRGYKTRKFLKTKKNPPAEEKESIKSSSSSNLINNLDLATPLHTTTTSQSEEEIIRNHEANNETTLNEEIMQETETSSPDNGASTPEFESPAVELIEETKKTKINNSGKNKNKKKNRK